MADSVPNYSFDLPINSPLHPETPPAAQPSSLPISFLVRNIEWYCRLRWAVILFIGGLGIVGFYPESFSEAGLRLQPAWFLVCAGTLLLTNLFFLWHLRQVKQHTTSREVHLNLWAQIISDLLVLTVVVHFLGSLETLAPFTYLFHIVMACVFFSPRQSFMVAILACILYVACISVELTWGLGSGIFLDSAVRSQLEKAAFFKVGATLSIWWVVWWLCTRLSAMIREQSNQLADSNRQLVNAKQNQAKQMLHTTHELKAPFAAIQVNTQLLLKGECGGLPQAAVEIVRRIDQRAGWLAGEIKDMLQLANLHSENYESINWVEVNLPEVIKWCIDQVKPMADDRQVSFQAELKPAHALVIEDHLKMLFNNLLTNAIIYSNKGGQVHLKCFPASGGEQLVVVEDRGIGIPQEKLPLIFNEYYRTNEAVRHNKMSSGLGLAIVRQIADSHGIRIRVESQVGVGSRFKLWFPSAEQSKERLNKVVE